MGRTIGEKTFLATLEIVSKNASYVGEEIIRRDKQSFLNDKKSYESSIKKESVMYGKSVKAVKELDGILKLVPGGKSELIELAAGQARSTIERVSGYKTMLEQLTEKVKGVEDNEKDLVESKKDAVKEMASIKKLVSSGFIEKFQYIPEKGMIWTYPPMTYTAEGNIYFLGRPEAGLSEVNGDGFSLRLPSYPNEPRAGTYHMKHSDNGGDYCLGGYGDILHVLAAKRKVTSLIRLFKEYFQSCNPKSKHNNNSLNHMHISLPKVTDDSWVEWKKKNPDFKTPSVPVAVAEDEEVDGCEDCGGDGCDSCN